MFTRAEYEAAPSCGVVSPGNPEVTCDARAGHHGSHAGSHPHPKVTAKQHWPNTSDRCDRAHPSAWVMRADGTVVRGETVRCEQAKGHGGCHNAEPTVERDAFRKHPGWVQAW